MTENIQNSSEEADVDFLLAQLGINMDSIAARTAVRSFRKKSIQLGVTQAAAASAAQPQQKPIGYLRIWNWPDMSSDFYPERPATDIKGTEVIAVYADPLAAPVETLAADIVHEMAAKITPEQKLELGRVYKAYLDNQSRSSAGTGGLTPGLMNATTVSCTGLDITIACNDHDTKDALMDVLADAAYMPAQPQGVSQSSADSANLRTFDTTGTTFRRIGKVLTITCDSDETANRVADQLRTEPQSLVEQAPSEFDIAVMKERDALRDAAIDFIAKVDRGEVSSNSSYAAFKAALAAQPPQEEDCGCTGAVIGQHERSCPQHSTQEK